MSEKKFCLLADPSRSSFEQAKKIFAEISKESDAFDLIPIEIKRFRDGELKPKIVENIRRKECFFIHDSHLPPAEWFLELCLINQALKNSSAQEINVILPYLKFSRQDRKDEPRVSLSARVIADAIQLYADRVVTLDVHNPATEGFYGIPFDNLHSFPIVINYLNTHYSTILKDITIMSTDAGGATRAKNFAKKIGKSDLVIGYKARNKEGDVEELKILGDVQGKNILIIDDMIDSGDTLLSACTTARKEGAKKVYAYCTHGIFSKGIENFKNNFDKLFISDSIMQKPAENIEVIPLEKLFASAILKISKGESISMLFN